MEGLGGTGIHSSINPDSCGSSIPQQKIPRGLFFFFFLFDLNGRGRSGKSLLLERGWKRWVYLYLSLFYHVILSFERTREEEKEFRKKKRRRSTRRAKVI